ncbi:hypothetical protein UFOVP276_219 [uncultured Caudovirales phage]|uniref:Uncharacterized protein n=1 Tax=uncultured Caudovirales phage TaxID=2100421 RepID=A0A6J5LIL9_9CAUD|nr:hypothetical protein UFOVP127_113 [uncultured Caudovirales phage]CAB4135263.1 hypothetical protein UFOVP276_219 [uncultured Caudovirales phage]
MFSISNEELRKAKPMKAGDRIICKFCKKRHVIKQSESGKLLYYNCDDSTFLAGIDGKSLLKEKAWLVM